MNLRARNTGLILLSALLFFSCGNDDLTTIGLPPENELGIFFVEIPLENQVSQVWVNDISSLASGAMLAGNYNDQVLGEISAQNFSEVQLPSGNVGKILTEDAMLDSLVLVLRINDAYGVDFTTNTQTIELHQLADTIVTFEQSYYNDSKQDVGMKLGEKSFLIYKDSLNLLFEDTDLSDSSEERSLYDAQGRYIYKTSVRLDDAFAQEFFNEMKDTTSNSTFSSNVNFANYIKGFRINGVPGNSAIMNYSPTSTSTGLILYFTQTEEDSVVHRTVRFNINPNISYNNITPNADVNWMGGELDGLDSFYTPFEPSASRAFVQAGTNLYLKLDMSVFNQFADTIDNPIIQNAELILESPLTYPGPGVNLPVPTLMRATVTSLDSLENGYFQSLQEEFSELPVTVEYNDEDGLYKIEIPVYLQSLVNQSNVYDQVIFSPVAATSVGTLKQDNTTFDRLVLEKSNIKIRLYYTIPNSNL